MLTYGHRQLSDEEARVLLGALLAKNSLAGTPDADALHKLGLLIDLSFHFRSLKGVQHALGWCTDVSGRSLAPKLDAELHYFWSNACIDMLELDDARSQSQWLWECQEYEGQILHLRLALSSPGFDELESVRRCQILTNLGNALSNIGRFVEAPELYDRALAIQETFPMAIGNRGYCLEHYAASVYDRHQSIAMLQVALYALDRALAQPTLDGHAQPLFATHRDAIAKYLRRMRHPEIDLDEDSLDKSKKEGAYRRWCLGFRLFLNPLNDLGPHTIAARDSVSTPDMTAPLDEGPIYQGLYNQLKQEFVSARFLYYEGMTAGEPHYSDARVLLYNTLDYPAYSLAIEKVKASFRIAYSLLDKIAFFLNHYLKLGIDDSKVQFRTFWYVKQERKLGLLPTIEQRSNWPLRGLFWIGKDLHDRHTPGFLDALEPDAQALADIRNHLEHKYLKLHEREWSGPPDLDNWTARAMADTLAQSVYRNDFEAKALRLLKTVRAALLYLALAIHAEEKLRAKNRRPGTVIPGMPLDVWEDDWKR